MSNLIFILEVENQNAIMKNFYPFFAFLLMVHCSFAQLTTLKSGMSNPQGASLGNRVVFVNSATGALGSTDGTVAGVIDIPPATVIMGGQNAATVNGKIVITGYNAASGNEPWVSDGTVAGTMLLKDINVGPGNSDPQGGAETYTVINNTMYFSANDGTSRKLWKTDGTPAGTVVVKDLGTTFSFPFILNPVGSTLLFTVGKQLWKSDGTDPGTVMVKDFSPGGSSTTFSNTFTGNGTYTFFLANDGTNGLELWRTDGTSGGTIRLTDVNAGVADGFSLYTGGLPDWNAHAFNGTLYFQPAISGTKLFTSNGTVGGTGLLTDINPSNNSPVSLTEAIAVGSELVFSANGELYKTNGTAAGTVLVKDINPGPAFSNPKIFYPRESFGNGYSPGLFAGGRFFFTTDNGTNGLELWVSDGTTAGTVLVKDINPGGGSSLIGNGAGNGDRYFYTKYQFFIAASNGTNGIEVWQSDGTTAGTFIISDIYAGATSSNPDFFGVAQATNKLVLRGSTSGGDNIYALDATVIPFPLTLTDFTAQLRVSEVALNWTTQNEINVSHFNIQRSITGKEFLTIARVNAIGSGTQQNYDYTDRALGKTGILYYRLAVVDKDGKTSYSKIQSIKIKQGFDFSLSSTKNEVVVSVGDVNDIVSIRITDVNGRTMFQQKQKLTTGEQIRFATTGFVAGIYFVTVEYSGNIQTKRFIK
jgi:ELWxxDGT repeat protein